MVPFYKMDASGGTEKITWNLTIPDSVEPFIRTDGGVGFRTKTREAKYAVSETAIASPWAVDEAGTSLNTHCELSDDGKTLTQVVETQGAVGEIFADPRTTYGKGVYINFTSAELEILQASGRGAMALAVGYTCAQSGQLRHPIVVAIVGTLCLVTGTPIAMRGLGAALDDLKSIEWNSCYQWKVGDYRMTKVDPNGNCFPTKYSQQPK